MTVPPHLQHLTIISAGAGSGKTYTLTKELLRLLEQPEGSPERVRANGIVATTFTKKAAAELAERVRSRLLAAGKSAEADDLDNAYIGTVHSIGTRLLQRFAFDLGISPKPEVMADEDRSTFFNLALAQVLTHERIDTFISVSERLGFKSDGFGKRDFRDDLQTITEIARANQLGREDLLQAKHFSLKSLFRYLPENEGLNAADIVQQIKEVGEQVLWAFEQHADTTKKKADSQQALKDFLQRLEQPDEFVWSDWLKTVKTLNDTSKKTVETVAPALEALALMEQHPQLKGDIQRYIHELFEVAVDAIEEYERFKQQRSIIDYTDMEALFLKLLTLPSVQEELRQEIDLLLVDEFQDTNPLQLQIFLRLTGLAKRAIWVGDIKQSIYGFRGAEPDLMQAVMALAGERQQLPYSWRSRQDLVYSANALFTAAFPKLSVDAVALQMPTGKGKAAEQEGMLPAMHYWYFENATGKGKPNKKDYQQALTTKLREIIAEGWLVRDQINGQLRPIRGGDIAILCRSNFACAELADALHLQGLQAAIARAGLVDTYEIRLALACLRYLLFPRDSVSVAEILLFAGAMSIEDIIDYRVDFLELGDAVHPNDWAIENPTILKIKEMRSKAVELSCSEVVQWVADEIGLRRIVARWGNVEQRFNNLEQLRSLAADYEDACYRIHAAATLGGFLLNLDNLASKGQDAQGRTVTDDGVQILTYHKSKGLEFPLVILNNLDAEVDDGLFGARLVPTGLPINFDRVLSNKQLCFWVNPFGTRLASSPLWERLITGNEYRESLSQSLEEEARLLYVGFTRARDYIVIPERANVPNKVLNNAYTGNELTPVFHAGDTLCPWLWEGEEIAIQSVTIFCEPNEDAIATNPTNSEVELLAEPQGLKQHLPYRLEKIALSLAEGQGYFKTGSTLNLPSIPFMQTDEDPKRWVALLHQWLTADQPHSLTPERRYALAEKLRHRFDLHIPPAVAELLDYSDAFHQFLFKILPHAKIQKKIPLAFAEGGRAYDTSLDVLLQSEERRLIVQYLLEPSSEEPRNEALRFADSLTPLLRPFPQAEWWVFFPTTGVMVELLAPQAKA